MERLKTRFNNILITSNKPSNQKNSQTVEKTINNKIKQRKKYLTI